MDQINLKKIKEAAEEFFVKTGLPVEVETSGLEDQTVYINLKTEDPQIMIGERGQTLTEIQRLLKAVLKKKAALEAPFYINLDINDYKKRKTDYLKEVARSAADEVILTRQEKQLPAMTAFERRVIHLELASREDVATESIGLEPERKVIIKVC